MRPHITIAKNTLYQIIGRIASSGVNFLIALLIAHNFHIIGYGDFAKTTAYVGLFYLIADFGLNAIFLQKEDSHLRFRELLYLRMAIALFLFAFINILAFFLPYNSALQIGFSPSVRIAIAVFSFTVFTEAIVYSASAVFQKRLAYRLLMIASIIGSLCTLLFVGIFAFLNVSLLWIITAFVLGAIVEAGISLFFTEEELFPIRIDHAFVRTLIVETLPIAAMLIFNLIYFRIDVLILSVFQTSQAVAYYDFAYKFFDFLIALPLFLSNSIYPQLLEHQKNTRNMRRILLPYLLLFIFCGIIVGVISWILSPLIGVIKGFAPAIIPLRILIISLPIFFATSIMQWVFITMKKQLVLAYMYLFATLLNIILNIILIPRFSYVGSAMITGIEELGIFVILLFIFFYGAKNTA